MKSGPAALVNHDARMSTLCAGCCVAATRVAPGFTGAPIGGHEKAAPQGRFGVPDGGAQGAADSMRLADTWW